MGALSLTIVTPHGPIEADLAVSSLTVPGAEGEIGVLPGHTSMVATLKPGLVSYTSAKPVKAFTSGGYVDVQGEKVTLLLDVVETPDDVDYERAKESERRAMGRLSSTGADVDLPRALASLQRAQARLKLENLH